MSLWGNKDTVYSTGTITTITDAGVITGNGTTWNSGNNVVPAEEGKIKWQFKITTII